MGDKTKISWADSTWNCLVGCSRVSAGCQNCYAERLAHRGLSLNHRGLTKLVNGHPLWTGEVRLVEPLLDQPLRWKRPRRIFVNSLSDVFHEAVHESTIARIFAVMREAEQHKFLLLTKRPRRMLDILGRWDASTGASSGYGWVTKPLPNVWLGVSVEDQKTADERIPLLLQTPAALRWVSYEPAIGPVDFTRLTLLHEDGLSPGVWLNALTGHVAGPDDVLSSTINWVVVGGESGPKARPFDLAWARQTIQQCRSADVACFVKQLGARPIDLAAIAGIDNPYGPIIGKPTEEQLAVLGEMLDAGAPALRQRAGADPSEWPADLRVQDYP